MMDVLILGGTGHLGTALRARLPDAGFAHHAKPVAGSLPFDLGDATPLPAARVIVGAFPLARQLQHTPEAEAAGVLARYIERCGDAKIVQLSTDAVYSGAEGLRREEHAPDPATPYGRAQAQVDAVLAARAPTSLVIRTSFIFGRAGGRWDKRLAAFADAPAKAESQAWPGDVFRSPTEVNFLAEGVSRAIERGVTGVLNIAGPRISIASFFGTALAPLGADRLPPPVMETDPAVARDTSLCVDRMKAVLGLSSEAVWEWYLRYFR